MDEVPDEMKPQLTYEEMPVVEPQANTTPSPSSEPVHSVPSVTSSVSTPPADEVAVAPMPPNRAKKLFGKLVFIALLFVLGLWLAGQIRTFFIPTTTGGLPFPTAVPTDAVSGTDVFTGTPSGTVAPDVWRRMTIFSGVNRTVVSGVSYQLPGSVADPVCDSTSCVSAGTNLPGGTRFTVAPRGTGQPLPDFRGAILTDTAGKEFTMRQTTIGTVPVYEYVGNFTGGTGGGYSFTKMRGVLVPVTDSMGIDFNHFAPVGATSDFATDDALFDRIVGSVVSSVSSATPSAY